MAIDSRNSLIAFQNMVARQGGGLIFLDNKVYNVDSSEFMSATKFIEEAKIFTISIYNQQTNTDEVSLTLLINPEDLTIGQSVIADNSYTSRGWVTGIWGRQQMTISGSGSTAGFYVQGEGLSNFNRRNSLGFINFQTLIALFKNNGYYFHTDPNDNDLFNDNSRVISVMDQIKIDYDGTSYVGSFSTFSFDDVAEMPYRMTYNLEFIASGLKGDKFEGHERFNNNELLSNKINIGNQWPTRDDFVEVLRMSEKELNDHFYNDLLISYQSEQDKLATQNTGRIDDTVSTGKGYNDNEYTKNNIKNIRSYAQLTESEKASVKNFAIKNSIPEDLAIKLFTLESGGTWNGLIYSGKGHARGVCQFTAIALAQMKSEMVKRMKSGELTPKVDISTIKNVDDLVNTYPSIEQQMVLADVYTNVTMSGSKSLSQILSNANPEDKASIITSGWFYPANINNPDALLPLDVREKNPGITTVREYTNAVLRIGSKANSKKTITTTSGN